MADETAETAPSWAKTMFWVLVIVFNVAVFFTAVALMVWHFEGDTDLAIPMLAIGVVAWIIGIGGYLMTRRRLPT